VNGLHARNNDEWERALERLITSPPLRARMGDAGRAHVEKRYAMRLYQADYVALLNRMAAA
jgi:glycosyltransferase involved in cell wall biosynthesis